MKILFNYASRSRPELFKRGIKSIINNAVGEYEILAIVDANDPTLKDYDFTGCTTVLNGISKNKVDAINRGREHILNSDCDIIVNMSDDMIFTKERFDFIIGNEFFTDEGLNLDQLLLMHDGNRHDLVTMSIMGKKYYERDNYIYNPEYRSLWCDNEATEVAVRRGCLKKSYERIFEHLHPAYGKSTFDKQYQETESYSNEDYQTYLKRKKNNFDLIDLSILIPSLVSRKEQYHKLYDELKRQSSPYMGAIEILVSIDDGEKSIGEKRNELQQAANGKYSCFFDDDDWPASDYISKIMQGIKEGKDCCSFTGVITFDGSNPEIFEHSLRYSEWKTNDTNTPKYERYPNHLNVIKTQIAKQFEFPKSNHGEDQDWSTQIHNAQALKTEAKIEGVLYHYQYKSNK